MGSIVCLASLPADSLFNGSNILKLINLMSIAPFFGVNLVSIVSESAGRYVARTRINSCSFSSSLMLTSQRNVI